jgi:hypothetical protein
MSKIDLEATQNNGFGQGLRLISRSDMAKAQYLLISPTPFYANTVENICVKKYKYDNVVHKLKDYITALQKSGKKKAGLGDGSSENPITLRTKEENLRHSGNTARPKTRSNLNILNRSSSLRSVNKEKSKSLKLLPTQIVTKRIIDQHMRI